MHSIQQLFKIASRGIGNILSDIGITEINDPEPHTRRKRSRQDDTSMDDELAQAEPLSKRPKSAPRPGRSYRPQNHQMDHQDMSGEDLDEEEFVVYRSGEIQAKEASISFESVYISPTRIRERMYGRKEDKKEAESELEHHQGVNGESTPSRRPRSLSSSFIPSPTSPSHRKSAFVPTSSPSTSYPTTTLAMVANSSMEERREQNGENGARVQENVSTGPKRVPHSTTPASLDSPESGKGLYRFKTFKDVHVQVEKERESAIHISSPLYAKESAVRRKVVSRRGIGGTEGQSGGGTEGVGFGGLGSRMVATDGVIVAKHNRPTWTRGMETEKKKKKDRKMGNYGDGEDKNGDYHEDFVYRDGRSSTAYPSPPPSPSSSSASSTTSSTPAVEVRGGVKFFDGGDGTHLVSRPRWVKKEVFEKNAAHFRESVEKAKSLKKMAKEEREKIMKGYEDHKNGGPLMTPSRLPVPWPPSHQYDPIETSVRFGSDPLETLATQSGNGGQQVVRRDLRFLLDNEWLNDTCINAYIFLLQQRNRRYFEVDATGSVTGTGSGVLTGGGLSPAQASTSSSSSSSSSSTTLPSTHAPVSLLLNSPKSHHSRNSSSSSSKASSPSTSPAPWPKCFFFGSFFLEQLCGGRNGYNYDAVRRITLRAKVDIFEMDKIIIPVSLGNHWCLACINFSLKRFEYYDSLGSPNDECLRALRLYLNDEFKNKKGPEGFDVSSWTNFQPKNIPRQRNGWDCGVFALSYAAYISRNALFDFDQLDMPAMRAKILFEIYQNKPLLLPSEM